MSNRTTVTFDGHDLTADYVVSDLRRPLLPRDASAQDVAGRDGQLFTGVRMATRKVSLRLTATSNDMAQRQAAARRLAAILAVGEPRPLAISIDGGLYLMAVPESGGNAKRYEDAIGFDVAFSCYDPVFWGAERTVTVPSAGSVTFEVAGTHPARPMVSASAARPSSGLWGLALEDGQRLLVNTGSSASRRVVADCAARTLTVNEATALLLPEYDWLELEPGRHTLTMTGSGAATVTYRERWL